jgi:hypothetical protein
MPVLDPQFRPAVLANHAFIRGAAESGRPVAVRLALEQADGNISRFETQLFPEHHPGSAGNFTYLERVTKLLLWARGGFRIHFDGPLELAVRLAAHYRETSTGKFDSEIVGQRMFDHPIEVVPAKALPAERNAAAPLGRHEGAG